MKINVLESLAATREILDVPIADRPDLIRRMRSPMDGMYPFIPGGPDQFAMHEGTFGFPVEGVDEQLRAGLEELEDARVRERVEAGIHQAARALTAADPGLALPEELTVLVTLGDPTDNHFMEEIHGLSAFGGIPGFIELTLWPNHVVCDRIEAIAAHEFHHNVRYGQGGIVWDPMAVALGEQIVAEGLADAFARELHGRRGYTHFAVPCLGDDAAVAKVISGIEITGMQNFTPWVLGDASARRFGAAPVGLPTGAGYAAGNRIVDAYLERCGTTAAASVRTDWRVVAEAGVAALDVTNRFKE